MLALWKRGLLLRLTVVGCLGWCPPLLHAASPPQSSEVYYGELLSESANGLVLNITPCKKPTPKTFFAPFKKQVLGPDTCPDGKKYTKIQVETTAADDNDSSPDKSKKKDKPPPDEPADKPPATPPHDESDKSN